MYGLHRLDAFCASCNGVFTHTIVYDDPGCCACTRCGSTHVFAHGADSVPQDAGGRPAAPAPA